jgi:hypothetical protein
MAVGSGLILQASYTEDVKFPAYQDRLLMKSLGIQAGVVEPEDFKVSAGTGLQINVKKGKSFVEQTKAIEESSNTFYNGLYNVLNPIEQNPYNNVEVSAVNPQIAQIIIRVYDVGELKIGGESYARLEWLNGSPNALATEAKMKEGVYEGAAALPQSSFRIAYVLVPKNATKSSEYYIEDTRKLSSKSFLQCREVTGNYTVSNGELVQAETENATITAPKNAPVNTIVGIFAGANNIKISAFNGIIWKGESFSSIKLSINQCIIMQVLSLGSWAIIAGEPKRENKYTSTSYSVAEAEVGITPSAARPATVNLVVTSKTGESGSASISVGGENAGFVHSLSATSEPGIPLTVWTNPGEKWNLSAASHIERIFAYTKIL